MVLDMPDSILTSLNLKNHQNHPKQRKNVPKQKSKLFFPGPLFANRSMLKGFEVFSFDFLEVTGRR